MNGNDNGRPCHWEKAWQIFETKFTGEQRHALLHCGKQLDNCSERALGQWYTSPGFGSYSSVTKEVKVNGVS